MDIIHAFIWLLDTIWTEFPKKKTEKIKFELGTINVEIIIVFCNKKKI